MPLESYEGETFVAFIDISGFKDLMRDENEAWMALDRLYNTGYLVLRGQRGGINQNRVEGLLVSDSGILFVRRNNQDVLNAQDSLKSILTVVKRINERMMEDDFMLTTSIAYGRFKYQERIEFEGIGKSPIYGNAYVSSFLDNENGKPKIKPGQCRIVKQNLPEILSHAVGNNITDEIFRLIRERSGDNQHYYFYWIVNNPHEVDEFERQYTNSYRLKYEGMLRVLKGNR
jgi:hypothetical protein